VLPALIALLTVTAVTYLWDLSASGYANSFYAAAVQAGTKSWKAFFFGSLDSSNFITVDKSPGSLWVMELSGRFFGFSSWSMLVPQVLEGVAAVGLLYATVKRWFGPGAGLLAGAVLACTPVAALMFRYNNPDALMVLLLVAAAYTLTRAIEKGGTRWMVATGALIGFAFLAKMLQAFTVVPAFGAVYLLAAPVALRRRLWQLVLGGLAIVVSAGWWVAIVALWPAGSRPMIDGSPDNSILNLIFGYNGLSRLTGGTGGSGSGFSGATGVFRLFNDLMGGQASWLLPASLLALVAGLAWRGRAPRTDRKRAALLLWGGWLVITGAVFSFSSGIIHTYYTVALAPAIAGLVGIGGALLWQHRRKLVARIVGAAGILATAIWAFVLLDRTPGYVPWLRVVIVVSGVAAAAALLVAPAIPRATRNLTVAAMGLALVAGLGGPIAFTASTLTTAHTGSIPSAGPTSAAGGFGGPGGGVGGAGLRGAGLGGERSGGSSGLGAAGSPGGAGGLGEGQRPGAATGGSGGFPGGTGTRPSGGTGTGPTGEGTGGFGGTRPTGSSPGGGGGASTSAALDAALRSDAGSYRWAAATFGSQSAATLELSSDEAVMAIGGFNGEGGNITLAAFEAYVAKGDIHYFIASGGGGGGMAGPNGGGNSDAAITSWVKSHFTAKTIGGQTVYDLADPK
jgi:4-amino-4-deoxy-L-arabinose transferase-like glycosyltransferase